MLKNSLKRLGSLHAPATDEASALLTTTALYGGSFLLSLALVSLVCVLIFRGGLMWHVFGIAAVTADGQPASRWRLATRCLVAWAPFLAAVFALYVQVLGMVLESPPHTRVLLAVLIVVALVVGFASALPKRSWADRLAGTWLVPR